MARKPHSNPTHWRLAGVEDHSWKGMRRQANRVSMPEDMFYTLQNVRYEEGEWVVRGGQTKVNSSPLSGTSVVGVHGAGPVSGDGSTDAGEPGGQQVVYMMEPPVDAIDLILAGPKISDATKLYVYSTELTPNSTQLDVSALGAEVTSTLSVVGSAAVYFGTNDGKVWHWSPGSITNVPTLHCDLSLAGSVTGLAIDSSGVIWAAVSMDSGTDAHVYSITGGVAALSNSITGTTFVGSSYIYVDSADKVYVAYNDVAYTLRERSAVGVWAAIPLGGNQLVVADIIEYDSNIYFGGQDKTLAHDPPAMLKWTGAVLSLITVAAAPKTGSIRAMAVFDSKLCYSYDWDPAP